MRWLPRSISGQLFALWVVAMLLAHLFAVLLLSWWRADDVSVHPLSLRTIEGRVVAAYRAVGRASTAEQLLEDISLPDARFELAGAPAIDTHVMDPRERAVAQDIRARLDLAAELPVHVLFVRVDSVDGVNDPRNWLERAFTGTHAWALDIELRLPDGRWLYSQHWPTLMPAHWGRVLSFSLFVGMLPTALIALLFGRRIMRPLRRLTEASRRVSRGEHVVLAPDGPGGIREITRAFNEMQESLIRFVRGRMQMIAAIGHDLRTPLTSLRIRAELIDDAQLRRDMIQTLDEMSVIVEETLQFAQDDTLQEPPQEVDIDDLLAQVVQAQRLQGRQIAWGRDAGPALVYRCRPVHLKRALNNIVDNAVRYGQATIQRRVDHAARTLRIDVDDVGPGIDPARLEEVFEPFARLDAARSANTGGTGLGLAIARSCVRAHGGDVWLHNRQAGGLRAIIELPL
ncbi:HAMP domain-containing protein [Verticiella sediminum]|uniref:histidine kinase n=1 Tax=Verticiella sediminum TaxID=1247510 RepID=A0A556A7M8_9BURK|nr:ATP-binding protein [Verticiella sediminum]TSH88902.1 HAMP domain-containing protein [Verticiella sediminum]